MSAVTLHPSYGAMSAGGVPAALITSGAIAALELFGPANSFHRICCSSGSVAPGIMWAAGKTPRWVIGKMIEYDFDRMFPQINTTMTVIRHIVHCKLHGLPITLGARDSKPFGYRIAKHVGEWPLNFITLSTVGESDIVYEAEGVFEYEPGEPRRIIQNTPAPVEIAVCAATAIPGMMMPVWWKNRIHLDGALNRHSRCPTSLLKIHCGAKDEEIFALLSPKVDSKFENWKMGIGRFLAGNSQALLEQHAALSIHPESHSFRNMDLKISGERKGEHVLAGFHATIRAQDDANYLTGFDAKRVIAAVQTVDDLYEWLDKRESNTGSLCI